MRRFMGWYSRPRATFPKRHVTDSLENAATSASRSGTSGARLAMKRKAHRMLKDRVGASLLLRSPDATNYPHVDDPAVFKKNPSWVV
jgi:hypothetical protein